MNKERSGLVVVALVVALSCGYVGYAFLKGEREREERRGSPVAERTENPTRTAAADSGQPEATPSHAAAENNAGVVTLPPEPMRDPGETDAAFGARHAQWGRSASDALVARLRELDLGLTIGKRIELSPAKYRCAQFTGYDEFDSWQPQIDKDSCKGTGGWVASKLIWKQVEPARYDYVEGRTPADDARRLKDAADLLGRLGDVLQKPDPRALQARTLDVVEKVGDLSAVVGAIKEAEARLVELKSSRKELLPLRGFIVASHGDGLYEVAPLQMVNAYDAGYGRHALVRVTSKEYTSRGKFFLWVRSSGDQEITTTGGFKETWKVYDDADDEAKSLDNEIAELTSSLAQDRKSEKNLASIHRDRRQLGEAIQLFIDRYGREPATERR